MFARFRDDSFYLPGSGLTPSDEVALNGAPLRLFTLANGLRLSWSEFGHRHGFPLVYFHSQAGSRLEAELLHDAALTAGFRILAIDRPGIGASDFRKLRGHSDFAADADALLQNLGIRQVGLLGWDGGTAFALAFSHAYPETVRFVSLLAPIAGRPAVPRRAGVGLLVALLRGFIHIRHRLRGSRVEQCLARLREGLCYADRKQFDNPRVYRLLLQDAAEAVRQGGRGVAQDSIMSLRDWDFEPANISTPVQLWRGGADTLSAACHTRLLQATLPNVVLHSVPRQGHFFFTHSASDVFRQARAALG